MVQLLGRIWQRRGSPFPERVDGIPIGRTCRYLHLLHADNGASAPAGTKVAALLLHYADGTTAELSIEHDVHVTDWWSYGRPPPSDPNTIVAWTGQNIRLYKTRFENPHPEKKVESLDYVSAMADPSPFMVALTVE